MTTLWSQLSPSTTWVLGVKPRFARLTCQTPTSPAISPAPKLWIFFLKTWLIARSLSELVRCLCGIPALPTLLELILAVLQLSVHPHTQAPRWQGLSCCLPDSALSQPRVLPNPLEALHGSFFFFFLNEWQLKLIPEPWSPKTFQHVSSSVPENILQTFSRFNWGFWEVLLCFLPAKIGGRYQEVLAYHIYLVSFENTESWD